MLRLAIAMLLFVTTTQLRSQVLWENIGGGPQFNGASILWDDTAQRFLVVDGNPPQIKIWVGSGWQTIATAPAIVSLYGGKAVYDVARQRVVIIGAQANGFFGNVIVEWDGSNWSVHNPPGFTVPTTWYGSAIYDPVRQVTVFADVLTRTWDGTTLTTHGQPPGGAYGLTFNPLSGLPMKMGSPPSEFDANNTWVAMPPTSQGVSLGHCFFDPVTNTIQANATQGIAYDPEYWDGAQWHRVRMGMLSGSGNSVQSTALDPNSAEILGITGGVTFRVVRGPIASIMTLGQGCPGALGVPVVAPHGSTSWPPWPLVGKTVQFRLSGLLPAPFGFPYMIVGFDDVSWSGTPLPLAMNAFGMPNCWLNQSVDYFAQTGFVNMPIPAEAGMIGLRYFVQGMGLELFGAGNGPGVSMSRSLACTVGVYY